MLDAACGPNMNTWFVAGHPIGHCREVTSNTDSQKREESSKAETEQDADKTFFMKARIFSGQADLEETSHDLEDFKWLAKEEIEAHVTPEYWSSIKNMLVEQ